MNKTSQEKNYHHFYEKIFWSPDRVPADPSAITDFSFECELKNFVNHFKLHNKRVLEIGSGYGQFQDIVSDYTGVDIVEHLRMFYHKRFFVVKEDGIYPFQDEIFDAIFTNATLEHIINIDQALTELLRVLRRGGVMLLNVAWQVRPWAAKGYEVRPWKDFGWREKLIKVSIPIRDSVVFRLLYIVPKRLWRTMRFIISQASSKLEYKKIPANYEIFWVSDSDACNSIDPHAMILWFRAHGCEVLNYSSFWSSFFVRTGTLLIRKK